MDHIFYDKTLYRIIKGRLSMRLGDLVLCVHEPDSNIIEESYITYDEAYKKAYFNGSYVESQILELLMEHELWSPFDDKKADELEDKIEELKVAAFKTFFDKKKLRGIKLSLRHLEQHMIKYKSKKTAWDHLSCEGAAQFARSAWIIENTTFYKDKPYDWSQYSVSNVMNVYNENRIDAATYRKIARSDPWRMMWANSKKHGNLFGGPACEMTNDQLALCSYSAMYDSVYESTDSPNEKVVEDDDCLDGWFVVQKQKYEKDKKQREVDDLIKNSKIANSQEVFVVASDQQAANEVYDLNNPINRGVVRARQEKISSSDDYISFQEFNDVKQDMQIQRAEQASQSARGRR
jgi:hypothetical protein